MRYPAQSFIAGPTVEFLCDAVPMDDTIAIVAHDDGVESRTEHASLLGEQLHRSSKSKGKKRFMWAVYAGWSGSRHTDADRTGEKATMRREWWSEATRSE